METFPREPNEGNPHVRFDEGGRSRSWPSFPSYSIGFKGSTRGNLSGIGQIGRADLQHLLRSVPIGFTSEIFRADQVFRKRCHVPGISPKRPRLSGCKALLGLRHLTTKHCQQTIGIHTTRPSTTFPATSVNRKSRPWNLKVSFVWSKPSKRRMVACRSCT